MQKKETCQSSSRKSSTTNGSSAPDVVRQLSDVEGERVRKKRKGYTPPMVLSAGSVPLAPGQRVPVIFSTYGQVEVGFFRVVSIARGTGHRVTNDERDGEPSA